MIRFTILFLFFTGFVISNGFAIESGMNLYGFSYHPDRTDSEGNRFQEWNPGFGYHAVLQDTNRTIVFADAGLFINSLREPTVFTAGGLELKLYRGISTGGLAGVIYSSSYNYGRPILAVLPSLSFRHGQFRLNCTYFPRYKQNRNSAFGISFTWFP